MFKIQSEVPLAKIVKSRRFKYPWALMQKGDSFFVPTTKETTIGKLQACLSSSGLNYSRKNTGTKFATRRVEGGVRVWRVK